MLFELLSLSGPGPLLFALAEETSKTSLALQLSPSNLDIRLVDIMIFKLSFPVPAKSRSQQK